MISERDKTANKTGWRMAEAAAWEATQVGLSREGTFKEVTFLLRFECLEDLVA